MPTIMARALVIVPALVARRGVVNEILARAAEQTW